MFCTNQGANLAFARYAYKVIHVVGNIINPRCACAARVTVLGSVHVSVCLSVTLHLTSRMSVRPRNDTIYPTGDEGQKICGVFSENAPLQS